MTRGRYVLVMSESGYWCAAEARALDSYQPCTPARVLHRLPLPEGATRAQAVEAFRAWTSAGEGERDGQGEGQV